MNRSESSLKIKGTQPSGGEELGAKSRKDSNGQPDPKSPLMIIGTQPSGWFVNLEQELSAKSQQGSSDPPGSSGVQSKARPRHNDKALEKNDSNDQPGPKSMQTVEEAIRDQETEEAKDPITIFAERVTIAGLEEAYKAPTRSDKIMFRITLLASFAVMVYQGIMISNQYLDLGTAISVLPATDITAPFPNITICFQPTLNDSYIRQIMIVPDNVRPKMRANNITEDEIAFYIKSTFSQLRGWRLEDMNSIMYQIVRKVATVSLNSILANGDNVLKSMSSDCMSVLSNCSFYGQPFDCCSIAQFVTIAQLSCFRLNMNSFDTYGTPNLSLPDPLHLEAAGFKVDVSIDWTTVLETDGGVSDGFEIFVDKWPGQNEVPISVPAGMDALITLAEPKRISEQTNCFLPNEVPHLKYFDHYDPYGTLCKVDVGSDSLNFILNCQLPMFTYKPSNFCTFDHIAIMGMFITDTDTEKIMREFGAERVKKLVAEGVRVFNSFANPKTSECKILCNRWQYETIAASYGEITYRKDNIKKHQSSNISWSRINIYMPQSVWNRVEETRSYTYMAFCDIGGMMGVYAGFSIITLAQICYYGFAVIFWWCGKRR